jgi:hypothetical protein
LLLVCFSNRVLYFCPFVLLIPELLRLQAWTITPRLFLREGLTNFCLDLPQAIILLSPYSVLYLHYVTTGLLDVAWTRLLCFQVGAILAIPFVCYWHDTCL